jgi:hypothetical protein
MISPIKKKLPDGSFNSFVKRIRSLTGWIGFQGFWMVTGYRIGFAVSVMVFTGIGNIYIYASRGPDVGKI